MNDVTALVQRIQILENVATQAAIDSRSVLKHEEQLKHIEDDIKEIKEDVTQIRTSQGRNFIVSLIAATASVGTIGGIIIALGGGG